MAGADDRQAVCHGFLDRSRQSFLITGVGIGDAVLHEHAAFDQKALLGLFRRGTVQADTIRKVAGVHELLYRRKQRAAADDVQGNLTIQHGGAAKGFDQIDRPLLRREVRDREKPLARVWTVLRRLRGNVYTTKIHVDLFRRQTDVEQAPAVKLAARQNRPRRFVGEVALRHPWFAQACAQIHPVALHDIRQSDPIQQWNELHKLVQEFAEDCGDPMLPQKSFERSVAHRVVGPTGAACRPNTERVCPAIEVKGWTRLLPGIGRRRGRAARDGDRAPRQQVIDMLINKGRAKLGREYGQHRVQALNLACPRISTWWISSRVSSRDSALIPRRPVESIRQRNGPRAPKNSSTAF